MHLKLLIKPVCAVLCLVTQSCLTLCDPMEWGSSQPRDRTQVSHIVGGFFYHLSHQGSPEILEWVA